MLSFMVHAELTGFLGTAASFPGEQGLTLPRTLTIPPPCSPCMRDTLAFPWSHLQRGGKDRIRAFVGSLCCFDSEQETVFVILTLVLSILRWAGELVCMQPWCHHQLHISEARLSDALSPVLLEVLGFGVQRLVQYGPCLWVAEPFTWED